MALIEWTNELIVGVQDIDAQHKKLVDLINMLNDEMRTGNSQNVFVYIYSKSKLA